MLCENCNKNIATVHYSQIVNGSKVEKHLCSECAGNAQLEIPISFQDFMEGFFNFPQAFDNINGNLSTSSFVCEHCHMTFDEFKKGSLLGCSHCYESFRSQLMPLVKQMNGATKHIGKHPQKLGLKIKIEQEQEQLKRDLQEAIKNENYELACIIRDKLKALNEKGV